MGSFGFKYPRDWAPEPLLSVAGQAEASGLDEFWVVEDLGFHGGFAQAAAALAATDSITVGIAIAPAVVRNTAFAAMEISTLARLFPGRFHMGFGHGVGSWIEQVGATPRSWLQSCEEVVVQSRRIVAGELVSFDGQYVRLADVQLTYPAVQQPLVSLGVRGPRSMALAGRISDGVIFAEGSGPRYVAEVRRQLGDGPRFTVLVHSSETADAVHAEVQRKLDLPRFIPQLAVYGDDVPGFDQLSIAGPADTWRAKAQQWFDAGADTVVFCPVGADPNEVPRGLAQ